jgi:hypothetical protein
MTDYTARIDAARFASSLACEGTAPADAIDAAAYAVELAKRELRVEQTERAREALCAAIDHARAALAMLDALDGAQ